MKEAGKHQVTFTFKNQRFTPEALKKAAADWFVAQQIQQDPLLLLEVVDPKDPGMGKGKDKDKPTGHYGEMTLLFTMPESLAGREKELSAFVLKQYDAPVSNRLENFDSQLAGETRLRALYAIVLSWLAIIMYLWFRFGSWRFGVAAVLCLIHGLLLTLGLICVASLLAVHTPIGAWFMFDDFKIDLPAVAALLTVVGYAVNDTIVIFDRIREVRGKNPELTPKMINDAVNQCLSRTLLTGISVFLVLFILYIFGGPGVHLFSFIMIVGVLSGTYGSIYVASPLLLIFGEGKKEVRVGRQQPQELAV